MSDDDQNDDQEPGRLRQMYEEAQARAAAADSELAQLRAREAFRDAGLDLANKQHAAFVKAYDGEITTEAVRNYVNDLGINETPPEPPAPPVPQDEQDTLVRIAEAARDQGGPPPQPDRRAQLAVEMEAAANRRAPKSELDRLSEEYSRAGGYRVSTDMPGS